MTTTFVVIGTEISYGEALYPLDSGTWTNSAGTLTAEVTNGNHLKVTNTGTSDLSGIFINITDITSGFVNNHDAEFTLSAGDVVKYSVSGSDGAVNLKQSFGWRKANTNASIAELAITGPDLHNVVDNSIVEETTLSADYTVGSMFVYGTFPAGTTYEYEFSLIVNNKMYI